MLTGMDTMTDHNVAAEPDLGQTPEQAPEQNFGQDTTLDNTGEPEQAPATSKPKSPVRRRASAKATGGAQKSLVRAAIAKFAELSAVGADDLELAATLAGVDADAQALTLHLMTTKDDPAKAAAGLLALADQDDQMEAVMEAVMLVERKDEFKTTWALARELGLIEENIPANRPPAKVGLQLARAAAQITHEQRTKLSAAVDLLS